jgi:Bacterial Ig-like domain (group 3)
VSAPRRGGRRGNAPRAFGKPQRKLSRLIAVLLVLGGVNVLVPGVGTAQSSGPTVLGPVGANDGCVLSVAGGSVVLGGQATATISGSGSFVYSGAKCLLAALDFTVPSVPSGEILVWEPWQSGDRNHHQRMYISGGVLYYSYFEGAYGVPYESNLVAIGPVVSGSRIQIDPFAARARTCEAGSAWKQIASFNTYPVFSSGQSAVFDFSRSTFGYWTGSGATPIGGGGGYVFDAAGGGCGTPVLQTTVLTGPTVLGPAGATDGCQLVVAGGTVTLTGQAIASIASSGSVLFTGAKCQLSALDITFPLAPAGGEILSWDPWQSGDRNHHQRMYISGGILYYSYFEGAYGVPYESYLTAIGPVVSGSRFQIDPFGARARTCEAESSWKSIAAFNSYPVFTSGQSAVFDFQRSTLGYYSGGSATPIGGSGGYVYDNATGGCGTPVLQTTLLNGPTFLDPPGAIDGCKLGVAGGTVTFTADAIASITSSGAFVYGGVKCQLGALDFTMPLAPAGGEILVWDQWYGNDRQHHPRLYVSGGVLYFSYSESAYGVHYESYLTAIGPVVNGSRVQIDPKNARIRTCETGSTWKQMFGFNGYPVFISGQSAVFDFQRSTFGYGVNGVSSTEPFEYSDANGGCKTPVPKATQATTTTSLTSQSAPWSVGVVGTFTATTISSAAAPISGTIELRDGSTVLSTQPVGPTGVTNFSVTLPVGPHAISAVYLGSPDNGPSTSSPVAVDPQPAPALDISIGRVSPDAPAIVHVRLSTKSPGSFFKFSLPGGQVPLLPTGDSAVRPVIGGEASWEFDVPSPPSSLRFRVEAVSDAQGTASAAVFSEHTVSINPCSGWSYELVDGVATSVCGGALFSYVQDAPAILLDNTLQVPAGATQLIGRTEFVEIQEPDYYGPGFQVRIKGTTKCWSVPGANPEEMIASVSSNLDPTTGTGILVVPCNKTNPAQWFYLEYGSKAAEGNWVYELRPYWNEVGFAVANGALLGTGVETPLCVSITEVRPPSTGSPRVVLRKCEPYGQNPRQYWKAGPGKQTRFDGLDDRPERPYPATGLLKALSTSVNKSQDCSATLTRLKNDPPSKAFVTTAAHCVLGEFGSVPKDIRVSFALMGRKFCAQYSDIRAKGDSRNGGQAADKDFAFIKVSTECNGALGTLAGTGVEAWQLADPVVYAVSYRGALSTASFPSDVRETFGQVEARRVSVPVFSNDEYRVDGHLSHGSSGGMIGNRGVISGVVTAIDPPGDFPQPTTMNVSQRSFRGVRFRLNSTTLMASAVSNLRNSIK